MCHFITNCTIPCDTRAKYNFCKNALQSIHKLASEIAFKGHEYIPFCHHCPFLKLTINVMTVDVIPVIVNIVVKVLLINLMTKRCWRYRPKNIPSGWKKKRENKGGKLPPPATKIMANAISWRRCLCFFTGTEERDEPTNNYTVTPFLSIMPCINILFLLFLFMIF